MYFQELLSGCSISTLEILYRENFSSLLEDPHLLEKISRKHGLPLVHSFSELLKEAGVSENESNIDNLQIVYAKTGDLQLYKKMAQSGAKNWVDSAVCAAVNSLEIVDYLLDIFTSEKRKELLTAYATLRYLHIFDPESLSLEDYLLQEYKEQDPHEVFQALAFGAVINGNEELLNRCYRLGITDHSKLVLAASASGNLRILKTLLEKKTVSHEVLKKSVDIAFKKEQYALLSYLRSKIDKKEFAKIMEENENTNIPKIRSP